VTRDKIHKILDVCLDEAKTKNLYGQVNFTLHCQSGEVKQITDESIKRTWREETPVDKV